MKEYCFSLQTLGTVLSIRIMHSFSPEEEFLRIEKVCQEFDDRYSRFKKGNFLERINAEGGGQIDEEMEEMLSFALELSRSSNGYFDPTIGPILEAYGYGIPDKNISLSDIDYGYQNVQLKSGKVLLHNRVRIELGGVGKGYLLGKIAKMLHFCDKYLIDFGGDIYARGGWDIALEHPLDASLAIGTIHLTDGYFCASSGLKRAFGTFHHLLDAHSKSPAREVLGAFVEADDGMKADGYATLLCVCPLEKSLELLYSGKIEGVVVSSDGRAFASPKSNIQLFS